MNFKRNILGLAVVAAFASVSMPAISAQLDKPTALNNVVATAPVITTAGFTGAATYVAMNNALTTAAGTVAPATNAATALATNATAIAAAQAKIVAANALTAGQLIGGDTKAQIVAAQNTVLGQTALGVADGTGLRFATIALQATATSTAATKTAADAAVSALIAGTISADISVGLQNSTLATAQTAKNGAITDAAATLTLGSVVKAKTDALGVATVGAESGLYLAKKTADAAVVTAATAVTNNGAATVNAALTVAAVTGVKGNVTFTATAADALDIRDGDTQLTMTVGNTAANNRAALIAAINAETGFSFTAAAGGAAGEVVLTYDDTASTIKATGDWTASETAARTVDIAGNVGTATETAVAGTTYKAGSTTTYAVDLANKQVAAATAATNVGVGVSAVTTATAAFDTGVALATSYTTVATANLGAAAAKMAVVDSVLLEEIAVAEAAQAVLETTAVAAEAITTADLADATTTGATLTAATATKTAAQATYDAAVATYIAAPTATNAAAMAAANTALATATVAQTTATTAATAATDVLYGAGKTAATALAAQTGTLKTSSTARTAVTAKQLQVAGIVASQTLQAQIAADAANPAKALQASLVTGTDTGGGVVAAVNSNYQLTKTNATGIATNVTNIATNTGNITTNTTNIATNTGNIATNATNIATNTAGISGNMASLQRVELQMNENVDMLKSGIASALAMAGMPTAPGEGMGFSIGTGYFDGESAVAMGLTFNDGNRSYKISFGQSGSETSASAGAAFKF